VLRIDRRRGAQPSLPLRCSSRDSRGRLLRAFLGVVEHGLVFGQEAGGRVDRAGAQAAGIVLHEPGEVVADAQAQVGGALLGRLRDVVVYACTRLCLATPAC
jgi:hypothetical protein